VATRMSWAVSWFVSLEKSAVALLKNRLAISNTCNFLCVVFKDMGGPTLWFNAQLKLPPGLGLTVKLYH
jgi:hypothetical protein